MKTSKIQKSKSSNSHSTKPFFTKSGEGSFFSKSKESEKSFFSPCPIQTKLTVGQSNDKYEQEADMTAEKVVRKLESPNPSSPIQRKCEKCEQEEKLQMKEEDTEDTEEMEVMRKPIFQSNDDTQIQTKSIENQLNTSKGKGKPMTKDVRSSMESAFGVNFNKVKIHTDTSAIQMNQGLNARAFTNESDIYFNKGEYNPSSMGGKRLLAHELTHVVQQRKNQSSIYQINKKGEAKKTGRIKMSDIVRNLKVMESNTQARHEASLKYSKNGLKIADNAKTRVDKAAHNYKEAYKKHEKILTAAKKQHTAEKDKWKDLISIGVGIAASIIAAPIPIAAVALMTARAQRIYQLASAVGSSLGGKYGSDLAVDLLKDSSSAPFQPQTINPESLKLKHYENLVDLYRSIALIGIENGGLAQAIFAIKDTLKYAELRLAGKRNISSKKIRNAYSELSGNIYKDSYSIPPFSTFQKIQKKLDETSLPSSTELERYIWLSWLSSRVSFNYYPEEDFSDEYWQYHSPEMIDIDTIEFYLYDLGVISRCKTCSSMLGTESYTGSETSSDDTKKIARLADSKWDEVQKKYKYLFEGF
ncbi:MAG: DUF4157 domain-containing protein [Bacteroidales bacterium]|nr:DUF4157 domain-containing protein [Bacteroidales bacterium]